MTMKLSELHELTDSKSVSIMASLSLAKVRKDGAANVRGFGQYKRTGGPNRADLRAAQYHRGENSAYGHIYSQSVDPAEVQRRRAKNKVARRSRAVNRKRG